MKSGNLHFLEPSGPLQACNVTALPLPLPLPGASVEHVTAIFNSEVFNNGEWEMGIERVMSSRNSEQTPASVPPLPCNRLSAFLATCRMYAVISSLPGTSRKLSLLATFSLSCTQHRLPYSVEPSTRSARS